MASLILNPTLAKVAMQVAEFLDPKTHRPTQIARFGERYISPLGLDGGNLGVLRKPLSISSKKLYTVSTILRLTLRVYISIYTYIHIHARF